jgi:hypothetical protein
MDSLWDFEPEVVEALVPRLFLPRGQGLIGNLVALAMPGGRPGSI